MISLFALRRKEPNLERPFKVPLYPIFPAVALIIATIALIAMTIYNLEVAAVYAGIMLLAYLWFYFFASKNITTNPEI